MDGEDVAEETAVHFCGEGHVDVLGVGLEQGEDYF